MPDNHETQNSDAKHAHASPTKDFFIRMITRDITLEDCILDLIDNSVDGARRSVATKSTQALNGFWVELRLSHDEFVIKDNCGGISFGDAVDYAFHFGRRKDAPKQVDGTIGLYGIGMKRAIFKLGNKAAIESRHADDAFLVSVDVRAWEQRRNPDGTDDWDFDIDSLTPNEERGTTITVTELDARVSPSFTDPAFANELTRMIARDYAFVIQEGFAISVGDVKVPNNAYRLKQSEDIQPGRLDYDDNGVQVRIVAGLIDEMDDEVPDELRPEKTDRFGWYVVCNGRVIVAGDKSDLTVWGDGGFQVWHNQYNGFGGFLIMSSSDPTKLPWRTTKREVDVDDPLYLRAKVHMKAITEDFIAYTNQRKANPEVAKNKEHSAPTVTVDSIPSSAIRFPAVAGAASSSDHTTIQYRKLRSQVKEIAQSLGDRNMSAREVGSRTFDYYRKLELDDK